MDHNESKPGTLNTRDWKSIGKSFLLTVIAAAAIAVADWLLKLDLVAVFGKAAPFVAVLVPFVVNFLRRWAGTAK